MSDKTGEVKLTVEFTLHAESVRYAEKWLNYLLATRNDDDLIRYEVTATEWNSID